MPVETRLQEIPRRKEGNAATFPPCSSHIPQYRRQHILSSRFWVPSFRARYSTKGSEQGNSIPNCHGDPASSTKARTWRPSRNTSGIPSNSGLGSKAGVEACISRCQRSKNGQLYEDAWGRRVCSEESSGPLNGYQVGQHTTSFATANIGASPPAQNRIQHSMRKKRAKRELFLVCNSLGSDEHSFATLQWFPEMFEPSTAQGFDCFSILHVPLNFINWFSCSA